MKTLYPIATNMLPSSEFTKTKLLQYLTRAYMLTACFGGSSPQPSATSHSRREETPGHMWCSMACCVGLSFQWERFTNKGISPLASSSSAPSWQICPCPIQRHSSVLTNHFRLGLVRGLDSLDCDY